MKPWPGKYSMAQTEDSLADDVDHEMACGTTSTYTW